MAVLVTDIRKNINALVNAWLSDSCPDLAETFRKRTKAQLPLPGTPSLSEIYQQYLVSTKNKAVPKTPLLQNVAQSSSSSDESDSSDDTLRKKNDPKKVPVVPAPLAATDTRKIAQPSAKLKGNVADTSSSDSDSETEPIQTKKEVKVVTVTPTVAVASKGNLPTVQKPAGSSEDSESDSSTSSEEIPKFAQLASPSKGAVLPNSQGKLQPSKLLSAKDSESSEDSSSDEDNTQKTRIKASAVAGKPAVAIGSVSKGNDKDMSSSSEESSEEEMPRQNEKVGLPAKLPVSKLPQQQSKLPTKAKDSSSSGSSSESEDQKPPKGNLQPATPVTTQRAQKLPVLQKVPKKSSSEDSSESEEEQPKKGRPPPQKLAQNKIMQKPPLIQKAAKSSSDDSSSESEDDAPKKGTVQPQKSTQNVVMQKSSKKSSSSSSSDESDEKQSIPASSAVGKKAVAQKPVPNKNVKSSSSDSSESEQEPKSSQLPNLTKTAKVTTEKTPQKMVESDSTSSESDSEDGKPQLKVTPAGGHKGVLVPRQVSQKAGGGSSALFSPKLNIDNHKMPNTQHVASKFATGSKNSTPLKPVLTKLPPVNASSSSSDSSSDSEEQQKPGTKNLGQTQKKPVTPVKNFQAAVQKKSSSDSSSESEEERKIPPVASISPQKTTSIKTVKKKASTSSSSSDSSDSEQLPIPKAAAKRPLQPSSTTVPTKKLKTAADSSSDDSSSSESETIAQFTTPKSKVGNTQGKSSAGFIKPPLTEKPSSDSSSEEEQPRIISAAAINQKRPHKPEHNAVDNKKFKLHEAQHNHSHSVSESEGAADNTFTPSPGQFSGNSWGRNGGREFGRKRSQPGTPGGWQNSVGQQDNRFRRVMAQENDIDPRLRDNSFEAKRGSRGSWGEKANNIFKHVKGKDFRHEKTKKKRGGYIGGNISTDVNSVKFDD